MTTGLASDIQIHPFLSDRPTHSNSDRWRYFFELPKGVAVGKDGVLSLDYDTSSVLNGIKESLTVLLNTQPLDSRILTASQNDPFHWEIRLPREYFKPGFNELMIVTRSRQIDGPCLEDDDMRNWVRFRSTTALTFHLEDKSRFPLNTYPFPYINWLTQPASAMPIVLGQNASDATFSAAFNLAASWGRRLIEKPITVQVTRGSVEGNAVHLGQRSELNNPKQRKSIEVHDSGLWITGLNAGRVDAAVRTLSTPAASSQMRDFASQAVDVQPKPADAETRLGIATFNELGYQAINLAGIGSQSTTIVLRRPISTRLGRGAQLRLRFRHAATLLKQRSLLSVTINNQPVGSVSLTPENANEGELVCSVPINLVDSNEWSVMITAHNELGAVECDKTYEDIAWTTILGASEFELRDGSLPSYPFLEGFPYERDKDGLLPTEINVNLGPKPSDSELSFIASAAVLAAQSNHGTPRWSASTQDLTGNEDVMIGLLDEEERFHRIEDQLMVRPSKSGQPTIDKDLPVLPSTLEDSVVVQAIHKANGGVAYVVLGTSNQALDRFATFLADPKSEGALRGQVAVFTVRGELFTFDALSPADRHKVEKDEMLRYKPQMRYDMTIIVIVIVIILTYIGSKFVKRKKPKK